MRIVVCADPDKCQHIVVRLIATDDRLGVLLKGKDHVFPGTPAARRSVPDLLVGGFHEACVGGNEVAVPVRSPGAVPEPLPFLGNYCPFCMALTSRLSDSMSDIPGQAA